MERLKKYCVAICVIDGVQTFIISSSKYDDIIKDKELLKYLKKTDVDIMSFIKMAREVDIEKIYLAFVKLPTKVEKCKWIPIHCYNDGHSFYHVHYRSTWMCRECKNIMDASIIMPMVEEDPVIYRWSENQYPDIPSIFKKIKCPKCSKTLQRHLIII